MAVPIPSLNMRSETLSRTGGMKGAGLLKILGSPGFNLLTITLREAVQNSWDARSRLADGSCPDGICFGIAGSSPGKKIRDCLREVVFNKVADEHPLSKHLSGNNLVLLTMYDRGTVGLDGPLVPGRQLEGGRKANFVDFIWQFGRDQTATVGGGTYGFGKISFYLLSQARTILVHTRCLHHGKLQQRLMACSIAEGATDPRETGRRWWGRMHEKRIGPLQGREAGMLARRLGLPDFAGDETGTSICVIAPDLGAFATAPEDAIRFLATETTRWFWPRMVQGKNGDGPIRFQTRWNDQEVSAPTLEQEPYQTYVRCLAAIDNQLVAPETPAPDGISLQEVKSLKPISLLGRVALAKYLIDPAEPGTPLLDDVEESTTELHGHHVALMRGPRTVVRYLPGPPHPGGFTKYAGAFLSEATHEATFASAEPPTHDNWIPDPSKLDRAGRRIINVTLRRLDEALEAFARPVSVSRNGLNEPLGKISDFLGGALLAGSLPGSGGRTPATPPATGGGKRGVPRTSSARIKDPGQLVNRGGNIFLPIPVEVELTRGPGRWRLGLSATVILDGGTGENSPPAGADSPEVVSWTAPSGKVIHCTAAFLETTDAGEWIAELRLPQLCKVRVNAQLEEAPSHG